MSYRVPIFRSQNRNLTFSLGHNRYVHVVRNRKAMLIDWRYEILSLKLFEKWRPDMEYPRQNDTVLYRSRVPTTESGSSCEGKFFV